MNHAANAVLEQFTQSRRAIAPMRADLARAAEMLCQCHRSAGLILLCGNGGSAADCAHIVGELVKGFRLLRPISDEQRQRLRAMTKPQKEQADEGYPLDRLQQGVRAINLAEGLALNTAVANDQSPELVFAQSIFVYGRPGDVLIALSTSGNSINVVRALQTAKAIGMNTIGLTGNASCYMQEYCDCCLQAPARDTAAVQEHHLAIYHALCAMVEAELFA